MTDVVLIEIEDGLEIDPIVEDLEVFTQADSTITVSISGSITGKFRQLTDVPQSYVGQAGKSVRVNGTEDGLEFFDESATMDNGSSGASLAAVTSPGNGTTLSFGGVVRTAHSMRVSSTGSPTTIIIFLQLFLDDWVTVATWTSAERSDGDTINFYDMPALAARAVLGTLTGGSSPTVSAFLASK